MNEKITVSAIVEADIKKVWDYYTSPGHIIHWNFADPSWHCPNAENDLKIGGVYKARMEACDGSFGFDFEAIYQEIQPCKSFTYLFGGRAATIELSNFDGQTNISVTFDPETENPIELQRNGWQAILDNFKQYTETH